MKLILRLQQSISYLNRTHIFNYNNHKHIKKSINNFLFDLKSSSLNRFLSSTNYSTDNSNNNKNIKNNKLDQIQSNDKQNVLFTIPNCLTFARIASIPFINYYVFIDQHEYACGIFFLAGLTDFLDGYVARNFKNQKSFLGSIIDPLADKLLIGSLTVTLSLNHMLPVQLAILILTRDLALIFYSLYVRYNLINKPITLNKFFNIKQSRVQVEADLISKINTFFQLILITLTLPSSVFAYNDSIYLILLQYLTGCTTILSSLSYLYKRGSYKVIDKPLK